MNKKIATAIKYFLIFILGLGILWLTFRKVDFSSTIDEMLTAKPFWLLLSVFASLVAFFSRAKRWNMLIEPLGFKPKIENTTASLMIGYFANLLAPRLGEVTRCGMLTKIEKIPFESLLGTVIIERIIDVLSLLACMLAVALLEYQRLGDFLKNKILNPILEKLNILQDHYIIVSIVIIALIAICYFLLFRKRKNKKTIASTIGNLFKRILAGIDSVRRLKNPLMFLFHTLLIWTMYFLMSYLCFFALKSTENLSWQAGLFVLVAGGLGMSAPIQGGTGAYHALVMEGLLLYGIPENHGLAFAMLMWVSQIIVVTIFGSVSLRYIFFKHKNATQSA